MTSSLLSRVAGRSLIACAASAALISARAQTPAAQTEFLPPLVTAATRLPEPTTVLSTNVDVVSAEDIARQQLTTIASALSSQPVFSTGQAGALTSIFMRGSNSNQTLFLV